MEVLVTGGGGFVGRSVVERLLARGYTVRSFGRSPQPSLAAKGVRVITGDLGNAAEVRAACVGVNAVFHVAAKAGVWGSWDSYYRPNVLGSRNVVAACQAEGVRRLVYTSTPSVVFNRQAIRGGGQDMPYGRRWLCHYAHTKAIAEQEILAASCDTLQVVALRPHLIFGPGDPHLLPRVIESVKAGRLRIVGDGSNRVDVAYVEDVAAAHLNALDVLDTGKCAGKAYFISQGEPVELWTWLNQVLTGLGHAPLTQRVPLRLAYAAGAVAETLWRLLGRAGEPPITRFVAVELAKDHYFDLQPAIQDLAFRPERSMEVALAETIKDLAERGF
ncbi:NAD-dependent epimerase/dehydratase family protein [Coraliomargarita sp. SDUM461004]|uniref:NAD-dependent epimerase/dehydratase family protein n=1 Tax=Thalassobacterium sedimentorum TaxID=3041258 RepID=A0ABU1AIE1_9BACT|nr:NAD-dependent epimerase/dehydratase family protein [Coraliomargarita sp. SDUM461004]MDQ8193551.1 NAD-dependent epimerase/dehydratase family protein [Coraliomargarita sp. SDUM461004]